MRLVGIFSAPAAPAAGRHRSPTEREIPRHAALTPISSRTAHLNGHFARYISFSCIPSSALSTSSTNLLALSPTTLSLCRQLKCPELDLSQLPFLFLCTSEEWFLKSGCRVADVEAGAASGGWWQVAQVGGGEQVSRRWQHRQTSEEGSTWSEEAGAAVASCPSLSMAATTLVKPPPPEDMHAHTFMKTLNHQNCSDVTLHCSW